MYFKACTKDLTGYGGFQFEIGKVYGIKHSDNWHWFHYTKKLKYTLPYYHAPDTRFLEVKPIGAKYHFATSGINYWTTNKLKIVREIDRAEVYERLLAESCSFYDLLQLEPPYEVLKRAAPKRLRDWAKAIICMRSDLTPEQKKCLLSVKHLHKA